jgi:DNA-binding MurR/RpiR family transcriptional regulator
MASRITQLAVVDALFVAVAQRHKNRTATHLQDAGKELLKRRLT